MGFVPNQYISFQNLRDLFCTAHAQSETESKASDKQQDDTTYNYQQEVGSGFWSDPAILHSKILHV